MHEPPRLRGWRQHLSNQRAVYECCLELALWRDIFRTCSEGLQEHQPPRRALICGSRPAARAGCQSRLSQCYEYASLRSVTTSRCAASCPRPVCRTTAHVYALEGIVVDGGYDGSCGRFFWWELASQDCPLTDRARRPHERRTTATTAAVIPECAILRKLGTSPAQPRLLVSLTGALKYYLQLPLETATLSRYERVCLSLASCASGLSSETVRDGSVRCYTVRAASLPTLTTRRQGATSGLSGLST